MASLRSRIYLGLLKRRHLLSGRLRRGVVDAGTSIPAMRSEVAAGARRFGRVPGRIEVVEAPIALPRALWVRPRAGGRRPGGGGALLMLHGGAYVLGSADGHRAVAAKFVDRTGVDALVPDYRLAPEHPYPAALDDAVQAYRFLLNQGALADRIALVGDSAGGGLALAAAIRMRELGLPAPSGLALLSPWVDLSCSGDSNAGTDPLLPDGLLSTFAACYAGDVDLGDPGVSPLFAELEGLPPMFVSAGDDEVLLDDSRRLAERAREAGVDVTLRVGPGMVHCYPLLAGKFPEATAGLEEVCGFVRERLGVSAPGRRAG